MCTAGPAIGVPAFAASVALDFRVDAINNIGVLFISGAYIAWIMWLVLKGHLRALAGRLAAAGRLSLMNYLSHTLLGTATFIVVTRITGGLPEPTIVVDTAAAIMVFQLWASPLWLRHFRFGPMEWLLRSAACGSRHPMRR